MIIVIVSKELSHREMDGHCCLDEVLRMDFEALLLHPCTGPEQVRHLVGEALLQALGRHLQQEGEEGASEDLQGAT